MRTLALLDTGSTNSFCTNKVVQQLSLHEQEDILILNALKKANSKMKTLEINLQVSETNCKHMVKIKRVYVKNTLPISISNLVTSIDVSQ